MGSIDGPRRLGSLVAKQDPRAGASVPRNTRVDLEVRLPSVVINANPTESKTREFIVFTASVDPAAPEKAEYKFTFSPGDGTGWVRASEVRRSFDKTGVYQVAVSVRGAQFDPIESKPVEVTIKDGIPPFFIAVIGAVLLVMLKKVRMAALAIGKRAIASLRSWMRPPLRFEVRARNDLGTQQVVSAARRGPERALQVRTVVDAGEQTVTVRQASAGQNLREAAHG